MCLPNFMFEPIEPRLTPWEHLCEVLKYGRAEIRARKERIKYLKAVRTNSRVAFRAYKAAQKLRDGTATIRRHKLTQCVTNQIRAENKCNSMEN